MNTKLSLEVAGGALLIFLGILFLLGLSPSLENLATDSIFIIFGVIMIRSAYIKLKKNETVEVKIGDKGRRGNQKNTNQEGNKRKEKRTALEESG